MWKRAIVALIAGALTAAWSPAPQTGPLAREFQSMIPCPSSGARTGACNGWRIEWLKPPGCGGSSSDWRNLRWERSAESSRRDRTRCP